jgi:hypothetical protein
MCDITRYLAAIEYGDPRAADQLLPLIYDDCASWLPGSSLVRNRGERLMPPPW